MKMLLTLLVLTFSGLCLGQSVFPMTVRERLRLVLWQEGIQTRPTVVKDMRPQLPEEIERPLRKI